MSVSSQTSIAIIICFSTCNVERTLHKSDMLFSLRNKNRRRENHSGRTTWFLALSGDRDVLFWGRFSGGTQHDATRRDAMRRDAKRRRRRTPPLKSQLFCRSFSLGRTRVAHESAREIFLAMTEVYQVRLSHVGSPAGERTQCARSNYILLCLSTTHLSTHPLFLLLHILLVPSFTTFSMSSSMSCWLAAPPRRGPFAFSAAGDDWTHAKSNTIAR